jgi:uncharacterized protein (TIGR00255 family)
MIYSMTAFARGEAETPWGSLVWELKSVNHRYLELGLRLPEELRAIEPAVREAVSARLNRGKVDVTLRLQMAATAAGVEIDEAQARRVLDSAARLRALQPGLAPLGEADVLRWPGVLKAPVPDAAALAEQALAALRQALDGLADMRAREGARLREFLVQRLDAAARVAEELRAALPKIIEHYRTRLSERLQELSGNLADRTEARAAGQGRPGGGFDPGRLEQELVLFVNRMDVAEELDRLASHVAEIRRLLAQGGAVGRRLDFLMQELNREANTLGSKAADLRMTNASVELKVLIDQMREQIQNIE